MSNTVQTRGITLIELLIVLAVTGVLLTLLVAMLPGARAPSCGGMKDSTQVRGIEQAMTVWASSNNGVLPLPSLVDLKDATVREKGTAKDTTANILSMLIYDGNISTELTVCPQEANTAGVAQDGDYEIDAPKAAADPAHALWDPAYSADFTGGKVANNSYAHLLPGGARRALWRDSFTSTLPIVANRGPQIMAQARGADGTVVPTYSNPSSLTFLIYGEPKAKKWSGNVAFNDGHAAFEARLDPDGVVYRGPSGQKLSDCLFFDEPDDPKGTNAFMGIFIKAGDTASDFVPIWD